MTELKPCPFCGSSDLHIYAMQEGIRCNNCRAKFTDCEDWMERWNKRAYEVDGYLIRDGLTKEDVLKELLNKLATAPVVNIGADGRKKAEVTVPVCERCGSTNMKVVIDPQSVFDGCWKCYDCGYVGEVVR